MDEDLDRRVRLAAFAHLAYLVDSFGEDLPAAALAKGFPFEGHTVHLLAPQGIFIPAGMEVPLTIRTAAVRADGSRAYQDQFGPDGMLRYRYRGEELLHRENRGLRQACREAIPLIWLSGVTAGRYQPFWPVFVHADHPAALTFAIAFEDMGVLSEELRPAVVDEARRAYISQTVRKRLHQTRFRRRVLHAYSDTCAICRLREERLLDAAHIVEDADPIGVPLIPNGLSLCKIHHAAFDSNILGIRPDRVVEVNRDIMAKTDGPMLRYGLQGCNGGALVLPRRREDWPGAEFLEARYQRFRAAG
ncbi:MAG: HNH endonuclease [Candidatus Dormibacteria bacterium]